MPSWYNTAWLYRIPVTVDNTANATSALAYYQVGVSLTGAAATSFRAHAKADGSDARVTDSDGVTLLSFALEGIDTTNNAVYLLVKVPRVAAAATSTIYIYYGNAAATSVSSYPGAITPNTALVGPTDIYTQADTANYNGCPISVRLRNQGGVNGGGAGLNGKILIFFIAGANSNGDLTNSNIVMMSSTNGGTTFGSKATLAAHDATYTVFPRCVVELADGTILLCYVTDTPANANAGKGKLYIARSTNGGTTWSNLALAPAAANPVAVPWVYGTNLGAAYGRMVEKTAGGDVYLTAYGILTGDTGWHSWLLKCPSGSDPTNGSTWATQGMIAFNNVALYSETCVIQTTDSSHYLAVMRVNNSTDLFGCTSADSGVTWTAPTGIGFPGVVSNQADSPDLLTLASGNILLTWAVRYGTAFGIGGVISTDHGATWLDRIPMDIATGANATLWDTGYPTAVQNADGTICVIGYYASVTLTTTNITRFIVTEDYVVNCNNVYDGCESFGTLWASHGVLATISPTHVHNGTNAIKIDNSGGSGGYATYQAWSANPAQATQRVAHSVWFYETANDTTRGFAFVDSTDSLTAPAHGRILETVVTATQHLRWYNGVAYQDTLVLEPENQWVKRTNSANVGPSSVTGQILVNNVVATSSLGMATAGAAPQYAWFVGGSSGTAHNVIYWLDDVYTHQYTANIPVTTTGSEQIPATGSVTLNPDTVAATATALLPTQAAGTIALRADTVAASAVAAAPGGATATGSFTLRADTVTCTVGPYYAITPSVVHPDPYHATTVS